MRITFFHGTQENFVQVVGKSEDASYMESLGFVLSVSNLVKDNVEEESKIKYFRDKIKKMGGYYGPKSGLKKLEETYTQLKVEHDGKKG